MNLRKTKHPETLQVPSWVWTHTVNEPNYINDETYDEAVAETMLKVVYDLETE